MNTSDFTARLATGGLLILDGATGTELTRRGVDTGLPLWSAGALIHAPDVVRTIHSDYVQAGADIITTNTFRTHRRNLAPAGLADRARELTHLAVRLAREAIRKSSVASDRTIYIAGSMSPLEDCYSPNLVPPDDPLRAEHREMARHLAEAGCDVLLVETMNTIREAVIATEAAAATGLPVCVSFVAGPNGRAPNHLPQNEAEYMKLEAEEMLLLSGESIERAVEAVRAIEPAGVMVNCVPFHLVERAFDRLRSATGGPVGLYANVGHADDRVGWVLTDDVQPAAYARQALRWRTRGASIIGGCCGTTPDHIAALYAALRPTPGQRI
jgi:homocysteine S-methyltransferase